MGVVMCSAIHFEGTRRCITVYVYSVQFNQRVYAVLIFKQGQLCPLGAKYWKLKIAEMRNEQVPQKISMLRHKNDGLSISFFRGFLSHTSSPYPSFL